MIRTLRVIAALLTLFLLSRLAMADISMPGFTVTTYASLMDGHPIGLAFDETSGALYVGFDSGDGQIWRVGPGGTSIARYGGVVHDPDAVAFDRLGTISGTPGSVLVGGSNHPSYSQGNIQAVLPDQSTITVYPFTSSFTNPGDMAFDHSGRFLFTDVGGGGVFQTTAQSQPPSLLFSPPDRPLGIAVDSQNNIFVSLVDGTIRKYDSSGAPLTPNPLASGLSQVPGYAEGPPLAVGPGGVWGDDIYTIDGSSNLVRINQSGDSTIVGTGMPLIQDLAFYDGALYASDYFGGRVLQMSGDVPEPSTLIIWSLLGVCGLAYGWWRRRRVASS